MNALIGDTPAAIHRDLSALIRRSTELQTGNAAADRDLRDLADGLADLAHDYLDQGAMFHLARPEREQQLEREEAAMIAEYRWSQLNLSHGAI